MLLLAAQLVSPINGASKINKSLKQKLGHAKEEGLRKKGIREEDRSTEPTIEPR